MSALVMGASCGGLGGASGLARREYLARCVGDGGGALGCDPSMVLLLPSSLPLPKKKDGEEEDAATDRGEDWRLLCRFLPRPPRPPRRVRPGEEDEDEDEGEEQRDESLRVDCCSGSRCSEAALEGMLVLTVRFIVMVLLLYE